MTGLPPHCPKTDSMVGGLRPKFQERGEVSRTYLTVISRVLYSCVPEVLYATNVSS